MLKQMNERAAEHSGGHVSCSRDNFKHSSCRGVIGSDRLLNVEYIGAAGEGMLK